MVPASESERKEATPKTTWSHGHARTFKSPRPAEAITISKERAHQSEAKRWPTMNAHEDTSPEATSAVHKGGQAPPQTQAPTSHCQVQGPLQAASPDASGPSGQLSSLWFLV